MQLFTPLVLEDWEDFIVDYQHHRLSPEKLPLRLDCEVLSYRHEPASVFERAHPPRPAKPWVESVLQEKPVEEHFTHRGKVVLDAMQTDLNTGLYNLVARLYLLTGQFPAIGDSFQVSCGQVSASGADPGTAQYNRAIRFWNGCFVVTSRAFDEGLEPGGLVLHLGFTEVEWNEDGPDLKPK